MTRLSRLGYIDARRTLDPVRRRVRSRGVPPALTGHEIFYAEDTETAAALLGEALAPARLRVGGGVAAHEFAAGMHGIRLRDVSLLYLDLHVSVSLEIPQCGKYYAVHMPTNGRAHGRVSNTSFEANTVRALVTNPGDALQIRFDHDSPQLIVRIEQEALERYLVRLTGGGIRDRLRFETLLDLSSDAAMRWHGAVQLLHTEVYYPDSLVHAGLGIGPLEDFLMSTLLTVQPSNYRDAVTRRTSVPGRRAVRRALEHIEAHLSEPITVADLAARAGVSVRSIQQGFRDELGVSPMAYLRDRRLERARAELADASTEDGLTVTAVAEHWGFHHLGEFAALYRKRWGEAPSQTLRR